MNNEKIRFGPFELDDKAGELRRGERRVRLQERPLKMLVALLATPGEVVTREELRMRLWPARVFVDFDNGLNNAVNKLRTALGDSATDPQYIETVGRRGYRFIGILDEAQTPTAQSSPAPMEAAESASALDTVPRRPPAQVGSPSPARRFDRRLAAFSVAGIALAAVIYTAVLFQRSDSSDAVPRIDSIAVLPLANLSSDPEQEYFSDGMTDALISQLAGIRSLRVISRQSVMRYKGSATPMPELAAELGVSAIIEGTVQKSANRVRISIQLIHAPTDRHLWAAEYARPLDDVIALQSEIARTVAREVAATVTAEDTVRLEHAAADIDPEAYDLYLRGRFFWEKRTDLDRALDYFTRAIAIQPDFARAHAAIAETYGVLGTGGRVPPAEAARQMRAAAERALEIDPDLVEALTALGACAAFHEWKWAEGERHFLRALEVNPNYVITHMWYGLWFEQQGRQPENLRARERAFALDPLNAATVAGYANALFHNGRIDESIEILRRTLEIDPHHTQLLGALAQAYLFLGRYDDAIELYGRDDDGFGLGYAYGIGVGGLGYAYARAGRIEDARTVLAELERRAQERYVGPHHFALVHVGLGDTAAALDALERGFEVRDAGMNWIKVAPPFAKLRDEPRFIALLEKMGLR
jgi:TolB-like protein/DNA-binding winged helix-turn-helix (wHTH) protein/Tfp pilus assembly protein PilF